MDPKLIRAIVERASSQLDLITRPQLHEIGVDKDRIHRARTAGLLVPIGRRTFGIAGAADRFERRVMAACLDTGGVASHRTSARLHRLHRGLHGPAIEVTIVEGSSHRPSGLAVVHSSTNLPPDDLVDVGPIPSVGVARTFMMLAALVPEVDPDVIRTAIGDAAREGKVSDAWLWWRLEMLRCRGRDGVTAMEDILRRRQQLGPTESWLEHTFLELLEAAGLPLPAVQSRIRRKGAFVARVDFRYEGTRIVIEVEGYRPHREQRTQDEARRRQLVLAGYDVLGFTYDEVVQQPVAVVADVRDALATAGRAA